MAMGSDGMHEMSEMNMGGPKNTLPMMTGTGQFGPISMGGMFTVLKVRDRITSFEDPGWYQHPEGSVASKVYSWRILLPLLVTRFGWRLPCYGRFSGR